MLADLFFMIGFFFFRVDTKKLLALVTGEKQFSYGVKQTFPFTKFERLSISRKRTERQRTRFKTHTQH